MMGGRKHHVWWAQNPVMPSIKQPPDRRLPIVGAFITNDVARFGLRLMDTLEPTLRPV
jgi:hypothetical protein